MIVADYSGHIKQVWCQHHTVDAHFHKFGKYMSVGGVTVAR